MNVSSKYKPLFKLSIYHSYFLNNGESTFSSMNDEKRKEQLKAYNWNDMLTIKPTVRTKEIMNGQMMVLKYYPDSLLVGIKIISNDNTVPYVSLLGEQNLTFSLTLRDPFFYNYTMLDSGGKILYFSNRAPVLPQPQSFEAIHRYTQNKQVSEDFLYGEENKEALLEEIKSDGGKQIDGILRLFMKGDLAADNIINNNGTLKNNLPHFKLHFDNRKTTWKYIHQGAGFETETKKEWPLTRFGFIELDKPSDFKSPPPQLDKYRFPNPDARQIKYISNKPYSEIFI